MTRAFIPALLLALSACSPKVKMTQGELRFTSHQLDFGTVFVGHPVEKKVELVDTTNAPADGVLSTGNVELAVLPGQPHSNGGETITARVSWNPRDAGTLTGYLALESADSPDVMELSGTAVLPPPCPSTSCHQSTFDADAGACTVALLPDGTACPDDPCLLGGTCHGGVCQGAPRDCDDHNACTLDSCGDQGCLHVGVAGACPMPSDPCLAAACDVDAGCIGVPLGDGAPCGPNDCVTAKVCIGGACVDRASPSGSICAPASICQDAGVCDQGVCNQPPADFLFPAWSYAAGDGGVIDSGPLVLDDDGNVYFAETVDGECRYVSLDPNGAVRWSQGTGQPAVCTPVAVDQAAGLVYTLQSNAFEAHSLSGGKLRWRLGPTFADGGQFDAMGIPVLSGHQSTTALLIVQSGFSNQGVLVVDRATGTLLATYGTESGFYGTSVLGDGHGDFLFTGVDAGDPNLATFDLYTLDSSGALMSSFELGKWSSFGAITSDTMVLSAYDLSQTQLWSPSTHSPTATLDAGATELVADDRTLWMVSGFALASYDLSTGAARSSIALGQPPDFMFATDRATVLALQGGLALEADTRGVMRMSCPFLPGSSAAFAPERLYTKTLGGLNATALPGFAPAASGWVESRGNARGDGQPK